MPINRPSSEARFLVEIDGVTGIVATETTPPGFKHTPVKYQPGNQHKPIHLRGNSEVEEMTFKHARAVNGVGLQLVQWLQDFASGDAVEPRTVRFITMDEAGRNPVETWQLRDCVPTMFKPDSGSGTGTNVATFSFSLQPDDVVLF